MNRNDALPTTWRWTRMKFLKSRPFQYGANEAADIEDPDLPRFVRITDVRSDGTLRDDTFKSLPEEIAAPYTLEEGDILLARSGATVGKAFMYRTDWGRCCFAGYLIRLRPDSKRIIPKFLSYFTQTKNYSDEIAASTIQATIQNVSAERYGEFQVPTPPLPEQRAIAAFLDRKTAQIDAVVAKKQRLIERLQEKRQALISHAVTKGLDPHAPMKDSGIEWLGEVPAHWNLKPLGSIVNIFGGSTPSKNNENYWTGGNIPWVSPKDMKRWEIDDSEDHITKDALVESGISLIRPPAILLVVRGMILARDVPVSITTVPVTINQDMKALVARPGCSAEFLGLLLRAVREAFFALIEESGHGTRCLRTELWRKLPLPIPPIEDQKAICAFVHSEVERATGIERRLVDQITKLQEYRQTLISAAVTGKIDVTQEAGS